MDISELEYDSALRRLSRRTHLAYGFFRFSLFLPLFGMLDSNASFNFCSQSERLTALVVN